MEIYKGLNLTESFIELMGNSNVYHLIDMYFFQQKDLRCVDACYHNWCIVTR